MATPYSLEADVYTYSGLSSSLIQAVTGKSEAEVSTLVSALIDKADTKIRGSVRIPITVHREYHVADGEKRVFELGPDDEETDLYSYTSQEGVIKVYAVYMSSTKLKLPYPKDCDSFTEAETDYGNSNCTLSKVANSVASLNVGDYYINGVFADAGYLEYPSAQNLNKNINVYDYISFILQTDDATATFTLRLYDKDDNDNYYSFTLPKADMRFLVNIKINSFSGAISWSDTPLYYWRLYSDKACTIRLDGYNFNTGFMWTYPYGELLHTETEELSTREGDAGVLSEGYPVYVTYSYDPFLASTPEYIKSASARLTGAYLWDHLAGCVNADVKLRLAADAAEPVPERDVMLRMKGRLLLYPLTRIS